MTHFQTQPLVRIQLRHIHEPVPDLRLDAKLFVELAHQRLFGRFAGLTLATREFPQARHVAGFCTTGQQDAPAGVGDHAGNDVNGSKRIRHGRKSAASERFSAIA